MEQVCIPERTLVPSTLALEFTMLKHELDDFCCKLEMVEVVVLDIPTIGGVPMNHALHDHAVSDSASTKKN